MDRHRDDVPPQGSHRLFGAHVVQPALAWDSRLGSHVSVLTSTIVMHGLPFYCRISTRRVAFLDN